MALTPFSWTPGTGLNDPAAFPPKDTGVRARFQTLLDQVKTYFNVDVATELASMSKSFVGSFIRDMSLADGTQVITGVGFKPSKIIAFVNMDGFNYASWGFQANTIGNSLMEASNTYYTGLGAPIWMLPGSGLTYKGTITTWGTDGFTITWTKTGATSGYSKVVFLALP